MLSFSLLVYGFYQLIFEKVKQEQIKLLMQKMNKLRVCNSLKPDFFWVIQKHMFENLLVGYFDFCLIFIFQNVRIDTGFPAEYFELLESSLNGSYHRVKALKEGLTLIDATLSAVSDEVSLIVTATLMSLYFSCIVPLSSTLVEGLIFSCGFCSFADWKDPCTRQPSPQ